MIRNVCIHVENEQPLLADLYAMPASADAGLVCTNVRLLDGKRPVFVDQVSSTFFFPYHIVRFLEIPEHEMARIRSEGVVPGGITGAATRQGPVDGLVGGPGNGDGDAADEGTDASRGSLLPVAVDAPDGATDDLDIEIDEDFLQRIRDI